MRAAPRLVKTTIEIDQFAGALERSLKDFFPWIDALHSDASCPVVRLAFHRKPGKVAIEWPPSQMVSDLMGNRDRQSVLAQGRMTSEATQHHNSAPTVRQDRLCVEMVGFPFHSEIDTWKGRRKSIAHAAQKLRANCVAAIN